MVESHLNALFSLKSEQNSPNRQVHLIGFYAKVGVSAMIDNLTPPQRTERMSRIHVKDT